MKFLYYSTNIDDKRRFYNCEIIESELLNQEDLNKKDKIVVVYPTSRLKVYKEKEFINKLWEVKEIPYTRDLFFNFNDFVSHIKEISSYKNANKNLSEDEFYALMKKVFNSVKLKYFSRDGVSPRKKINKLISSIIFGFIKKGITLEQLNKDLESNKENELVNPRLTDIVAVYSEFLEISKGYSSPSQDIVNLQQYILENKIDFTNITNDIFYFEHFKEFNKNEIDLLNILIKSNLKIVINFKFLKKNMPSQNNLLGLQGILSDKCSEEILNNEDITYNTFSEYLFSENNKLKDKLNNKDKEINIIEASDPKREMKYILTLVKKLIKEEEYKASEILILSRQASKYSKPLKELFDRNKVPLNISDRYLLKDSLIVNLIINYLKLFTSSYKNIYLHRVILSPFLKHSLAGINIHNFVSIQKKYRNYYGDLKNRKEYFNKIINNNSNNSNNSNNRNEIDRHLEDLNRIYKALNLENISGSLNKEEALTLIKRFIKLLKFDFEIIKDTNAKTDFNNFLRTREREKIFSAVNELINSIESIYEVNKSIQNKEKLCIYELVDELEFSIDKSRYQIRELFDTSVTLTSIEQARGIDRKVTIICGMIEGEFPLYYETDKVLGVDLTNSEEKHNLLEEELFFEALFANEKLADKTYLTYYKTSGTSENIRSHYINEIEKVCEVSHSDFKATDLFIDKHQLENNIEIGSTAKDIESSSKNLFLGDLTKENKEKIKDERNIEYSASRFDELYNYPFYYAYNRIFEFYEENQFDEEPMANEIGTINHSVLQKLYSALSEISKLNNTSQYLESTIMNLSRIYPANFDTSDEEIDKFINEILNEVFKEFADTEFFSLQRDITFNRVKSVYENDKKLKSAGTMLFPAIFELEFSKKINILEIFDNNNNSVKFKGLIDRIDISFEDNNINIGIIDYKSSQKSIKLNSKFSNINYSFQMYIYFQSIMAYLKNYYIYNSQQLNESNINLKYISYYNINKLEIDNYYPLKQDKRTFEELLSIINFELFSTLEKLENIDIKHNNITNKYKPATSLLIR